MGKTKEKVESRRCTLAESNLLIVGPEPPGCSALRSLASFVQQHHREGSASFAFATHPMPDDLVQESKFVLALGPGAPRSHRLPRGSYIPILSRILDMVLTVLFLARVRRRYDMYIGAGLDLILLGVLLKKLGLVKKAAGFATDYWPERYGLRILDRMYRALHNYCFNHMDYVLNSTPAMAEVLIRQGVRVHPDQQITVPTLIEPAETGFLPREQLEPDSLVWVGAAGPEYGFELVLEAMELVVRERPAAVVDVASYSRFPNHLHRMITERGLTKHFRLLGFIQDEAAYRNFLRKHRVGLAPYRPIPSTQKRYADVGRPKLFMANGVPPIITRVPPIAAEIEEAGAGLVIDYDKGQLATAILSLLSDDQLHQRCRQRGLELVKKYKASSVCGEVFTRLGMPPDD